MAGKTSKTIKNIAILTILGNVLQKNESLCLPERAFIYGRRTPGGVTRERSFHQFWRCQQPWSYPPKCWAESANPTVAVPVCHFYSPAMLGPGIGLGPGIAI
jgi:hypothetical protein